MPKSLLAEDGDWVMTWQDDFTDAARFASEWTAMTNIGDFTQTLRQPANVDLLPGGLALELGHNPGPERTRAPFTGGYIRSRAFRQRYGYFECEMRIASEPGVNNAFWLFSDPGTRPATTFELDVAEAKYPNAIQASARQWAPRRRVLAKTLKPDLRLADSFHRFGLLWSPTRFSFSFTDHVYFTAPNSFAHSPAQIRFSNAVAAFAGANDGDVRGAATTIRNLRVFQNTSWT